MSSNHGAVTRTGIFNHKKNKNKSCPTSGERLTRGRTKFDFTFDEGKGLNSSRDKKIRQAPQKKGGEILCDLPSV